MASSGWQGAKTITNWGSYSSLQLNLRIDSLTHSGGTVTGSGVLRLIYRNSGGGTGSYAYTVSATPAGGSKVSFGTWSGKSDGYYQDKNVSWSFSASSSATSGTLKVNWSSTSGASGSASWTVSFPQSGTAPTGGYVNYISSTWNAVNVKTGVTSWGGLTGTAGVNVITGSTNGDADNVTSSTWTSTARRVRRWHNVSPSTLSVTGDMTTANTSTELTPLDIKGLLHYKLSFWNSNSAGNTHGFDNTLRYLPPAPSQLTYTDPGGSGPKTYPVTFASDLANNHTTYDSANLTRTIRYKIDNGAWAYVDNATVAALDVTTTFNVTVPAGSVATIEGWQTYHGMDSDVATITLSNTNTAVALYGSVNNQAKLLGPVYASVNGRAKKLIKIYASVGGVTKKVYEDV